MFQQDNSNTIFSLAADLVNHTSQDIFLTGKAGTGKTTFLKYIKEHTKKNIVIVAPTGVAAINAGGVTMHSFFQLPRGMFVPGIIQRNDVIGFADITDRHSLFKNIHFASNKRQLLQELELLVIDEVSMVRCDMLDAIDTVLRHFRKAPHLAFGGVQVVYIGDMFQLPPVINNDEWNVLQQYYESPFFFSAKAISEAPPLYIELKKIYRQSEHQFIEVLNRIRNNNPEKSDFDFLNSKYDPAFISSENDHYITITTHNKKAEAINQEKLSRLPGKLYSFKAVVKDDFSDKAFPTDIDLQLKIGAQVMFIKNDSSSERRYFNGKIAVVKSIVDGEITVTLSDDAGDLVLEKETWKNLRYIYNKENDDIDEEELGSFTQYPIRLAWAITIHKSQGLTFDKAVIDAGSSFAPGQVYVALSRCTSMDGVVLKSRIFSSAISTDKRIIEFAQKEIGNANELEQILEREKYRHWAQTLVRIFDWSKLTSSIQDWLRIIPDKKLPDTAATLQLAQLLLSRAREQNTIARKFQQQLNQILTQTEQTKDTSLLQERMEKAVHFFANGLTLNILAPLQEHIADIHYATKINKYKEQVKELEGIIWTQVIKLVESNYGLLTFGNRNDYRQFDPLFQKQKPKSETKTSKQPSQEVSYELFQDGKSIDEIASLRNMAISTIQGHLATFVITGQIDATLLVESGKLQTILEMISQLGDESTGLIKSRLGDDFSYHEIRVGLNHHRYCQKQSA